MTELKNNIKFLQVHKMLQDELEKTMDLIMEELAKENSEEVTKNLSNYIVIMSNINQGVALLNKIKLESDKKIS